MKDSKEQTLEKKDFYYSVDSLYYPLANEDAKGYSNAIVRSSVLPSVRHILVNTLGSTSFNGF
jgi:hypothetical protein